MNDFKNMLILSYFFQYKNDYLLSKLQVILGLTTLQLENRILELIDCKMLEYNNNLLSITTKGIQKVVSNNFDSFPFEINNELISLDVGKAIKIDDIYIPNNFLKKYRRIRK